jgi:hypothetical protein
MTIRHLKATYKTKAKTTYNTYHDPIGRVIIRWIRVSTLTKKGRHFTDRSLKHDATLVHENQSIKRIKNLGGRLMDRKEDR